MATYYDSPIDVSTKDGYRNALDRYGFGKSMRSHAADRLATADFGRQLDRIDFMGRTVEPARQDSFNRILQTGSSDYRLGSARRQGGSILQRVMEQNRMRGQQLGRAGVDRQGIAGINALAEAQGQENASLMEAEAMSPEAQAELWARIFQMASAQRGEDNPIYQSQQQFQEGRNDQRDAKNSSQWSGLFGTGAGLIPYF